MCCFIRFSKNICGSISLNFSLNDPSFIWSGAEAFLRDDKNAKAVPLGGGHFVLESHYKEMAKLILEYFGT